MADYLVDSGFNAGAGTLRTAVLLATDGDTITIDPTVTAIGLLSPIVINASLTITGPGSSGCNIICPIPYIGTALDFQSGVSTLSGVRFTGFTNGPSNGGAIFNGGTLTLSDVKVINCSAFGGGAIANESTLWMTSCEINGCSASFGGGIHNIGTLTLTDCRIYAITMTGDGGGIYNDAGTVDLTRVVFDSISVNGQAGGIFNTGTLTLIDCTINACTATVIGASIACPGIGGTLTLTRCTIGRSAGSHSVWCGNGVSGFIDNSTFSKNNISALFLSNGAVVDIQHSTIAGNGGHGFISDASGVLIISQNNIIAGNTGDDLSVDPSEFLSNGYNAIGTNVPAITTTTGDITGLTYATLKISALADNTGPTETMALLFNSPCLDAGTNTAAPATDQRGQPRVVNGTIDIGAYEGQPVDTPTGAGTVVYDANCYICNGASYVQAQMLVILGQIVITQDPMADISPQTLLNNGRCFQCYGPISAGDTMLLSMLSLIQAGVSGVGSLSGTGSPVGVVTPNYVGQYYTDLSAPGGIWVSNGTTNADWRQYVG